MCGICGVYFQDKQKLLDEPILTGMRDSMRLRGPDSAGNYLQPGIALGHRRLSIIDLDLGHQPMTNVDESLWLTYNGEIYNFQEIRKGLEAKGHPFKTNSDTEVILHAYEEYGRECVKLFNGMFSFAIYDAKEHSLFLARDRLGIKPLYYFQGSHFFAFASSLKALLNHPDIPAEIDPHALSEYLLFEYVPAPLSMIKNIRKLMPGHTALIQGERVQIEKYWDLQYREQKEKSFSAYQEEFQCLIKDSVKKRLISDVPLGMFLSGGIDSSAILSYMSELGHRPLKTFSIGFNENSFNELHHARRVAQVFETDHHEMLVTPQKLIDLFPKVLEGIDDPLGDPSAVPTYLVSQLARNHVTVCLSGDGGDELFAGYPTYQALKLWKLFSKFPKSIQKLFSSMIFKMPTSFHNISLDYKLKKFMEGMPFPIEQANILWKGAFLPDEKNQILSSDFLAQLDSKKDYFSLDPYLKEFKGSDLLNKLLFLDTKVYMQDDILAKVDRMSMANSLEVRVPFLDHNIAEFAARLPVNYKLKGFKTKYIVKQAMKERLPSDIIQRKKKGFGIPFAKWVAEEVLKKFVLDTFSEARNKANNIINFDCLDKIMHDHLAKVRDSRKPLWTILIFLIWLDNIKSIKQNLQNSNKASSI